MSRDERLMREALRLAEEGLAAGDQPIGAVVALDGEVVASARWRLGPGRVLWQPDLGHLPENCPIYAVPEVVGGVCRKESLALATAFADRHPDLEWARRWSPASDTRTAKEPLAVRAPRRRDAAA